MQYRGPRIIRPMANVFISHRLVDATQARHLAADLRTAGHEVWLDDDEILAGDSILGKMNEGLERAQYVVVCYSSSGIGSPYMSREWLSALARQLDGRGVKLLPVRLTGDEAPAILADIKHADLVANWNDGLAELLRAIK